MDVQSDQLKRQIGAIENERRHGAVAAVREEAAREKRVMRMRYVLGGFLLEFLGGSEQAPARLRAHPVLGPALDAYITGKADRRLLGYPADEPESEC